MSVSRDASFSSSAPDTRHKPMNMDEKVAYLEVLIKEKEAERSSISSYIRSLSTRHLELLEKEELSSREEKLLAATEVEIARATNSEAELKVEIAKHDNDLRELQQASKGKPNIFFICSYCRSNNSYLFPFSFPSSQT